ncbi:MAG: hypothetical protein MK297_09820 [Planctomycetes bacterium]|nr:hypothetical protein [Planctomycetota bacterium]
MPKKTAKKKTTKKKATKKAAKKTTRRTKKKGAADFIISKSRTKAAAGINVSSEFYAALDTAVRAMINEAEERACNNGRKTLRPHDL